jgi:PAS domain S-box-containing protein
MTKADLNAELTRLRAENHALRQQAAVSNASPLVAKVPAFALGGLLSYLLADAGIGVVLTDADYRVQWANDGFTALTGLPAAAVLGQRPATFLRGNVRNTTLETYIEERLHAQQAFWYELPQPAGAAVRWLRVSVRPVPAQPGEPVRYVGLLEDITAWKQEQLAHANNNQRFRSLAENVPGVLYEWRKYDEGHYQFDYVSPKVRELFGVEPEALSRMTDFIHPDELEGFLQNLDYATRHRLPWSYKGRLVVAGQPMRWMQGNANVIETGLGWVRYSGILLDVTPLKVAETAVRENAMRQHLALEGFGDGIWEKHLNTACYYFSQEYKAMLGYSEEAFAALSEDARNIAHPDDVAAGQRVLADYLAGVTPAFVYEVRLRCADGRYKWVLSRAMITARDAAGLPTIITGFNTDITALKDAQHALGATNRRLNAVIDNLREGIVLEDENRRIMLVNEAFCEQLPKPTLPAQLIGMNGTQLAVCNSDYMREPTAFLARVAVVLAHKELVLGDKLELRDGRVLQRDYIPIHDELGRYLGQLWKFQDVTGRTRAEAELRRREEKYRGIIENMALGLVEADLDDHLIYANQSFCDMTGFCIEDLQGQRLSPLLLTGDDLVLVESKLQSRQNGISDSYEIKVTTKTGAPKWLLVSGAPLHNSQQQHIGSIGIYLDVSPQKQLEARLREAKAVAETSTHAKQHFLANMSHEIRTPMNAILGMSQLLQKTTLDATQGSYLHAITASADTLLVIINDILDSAKMEAGHLTIERIGFDPAGLCRQVEKTLRYRAEEKGLLFETQFDPALPAVLFSDPHRLTQVLLNLAGNAIKFTEQGRVRLAYTLLGQPTPHEVLVEFGVEDSGVGIEADYLKQIFEEFSQEDSSVTRQFGGTGLGLSISQKLVALLGGELHLESRKQVGTRSWFVLRLPVGHPQSLVQKQYDDLDYLHQALRGKRLLLVEDNTFNRMLATIFLRNAGIEVHEAANGQLAVDQAREQSYDLILMDVQMPVLNGYQATAQLRQALRLATPIVALTANAIVGERDKCLAAGMNDYLTKPFEEVPLLKMVYKWAVGYHAPQATGGA